MEIIVIKNLKKYFGSGENQVKALDGIDLSMERGKMTAIIGASGSGKTTLFNVIGGLYRPTEGTVIVDQHNLAELSEEQLTIFRRRKIGFIFQDYRLVPELTVQENILFPLALDDNRINQPFFDKIITLLGLNEKLDAFPYMLSGGQQQCTAIARAFITKPSVILADEPTGNLDSRNSQDVIDLLMKAARQYQQTILMITHNNNLTASVDRVFRVTDGILTDLGGKENEKLS